MYTCSYFQLGEYFLDVAVAALCYVHVLLVCPSLEHGLRGVGEVLVEGERLSHDIDLHCLALFRPDFAHELLPSRDHL